MQILLDSVKIVTSGTGFWFFTGCIISFGMIVGAKLNEGGSGLRRSLIILLPFTAILFSTNLSRVFDYARINGFGGQSFTNTVSLIFIALAYVAGLGVGHIFIGHILKPYREQLAELERERQSLLLKKKEKTAIKMLKQNTAVKILRKL